MTTVKFIVQIKEKNNFIWLYSSRPRAGRIKEAKYYSQPNLSDLAIPVSRRDKGGMGGHEG